MSGDYGTIMESIMCEQSTPMLKNAIDVYTQYEKLQIGSYPGIWWFCW